MTIDDAHHRHRTGDSDESAAAAKSVTDLTRKQQAVLDLIRAEGPLSDYRLVMAYQDRFRLRGWPEQSESGIRTRRNELAKRGKVVKDERRVTLPTGRKAALWREAR